MARPGSQQVAGYFPTPSRLLPSFASILRWPEPEGATYLLDPCAGEGTAVGTLRDLWTSSYLQEDDRRPAWQRPSPVRIVACELEEERAGGLRRSLEGHGDAAYHADAFRLYATMLPDTGATVLYLNPPYDHDPEHGRLEHRFLLRFSQHLHPGAGFLFYLVPFHALAPSAEFLGRHFLDLRAWRLPNPEWEDFHQVLLVARRARRPLAGSRVAETVLRWSREPETLPVLPERCTDPLTVEVDAEPSFDLRYEVEAHDLTASLQGFRPWDGAPVGVDVPARELLGTRFHTAVPPKPAHIALALSSGMFNGHRLEPNDPARRPALLAKGTFERELIQVSERVDSNGLVTGAIEVEAPRLRLTILRLDDYTFHTLGPGTVPTGDADPARWNAADLIAGYDRSLARLLARQFPPLHDPQRASQQIALPRLARAPFRAQAQAIQAALKLLARGTNPFFVAEVGTGKSTMALVTAAALSPEHHEATTAELRRVGLRGRLPVVRKTLIVCPPHLLKSWTDQVAAVLPEARVQVLGTIGDLERPADFYILSRETAKLGSAHEGVAERCPRCGAALATSPQANVSRRLRCRALRRRAADLRARLAETLAALLAPSLPEDPLIESLLAGEALRRRLEGLARPRCLPLARLLDFLGTVLREVEAMLGQALASSESRPASLYPLLTDLLPTLAGLLPEAAPRTLEALRGFLPEGEAGSFSWGPVAWLRSAIATIEREAEEVSTAGLSEERSVAKLRRALEGLHAGGTWIEAGPCGEPLYQAVPRPRRYPLAQRILRRHRRDFDLLILDEAHEFNHASSAQAKAAHRLSALPGVPTIVLTGSLMGGYASSLFANFWALSREFRGEFGRDEEAAFVARYGYRKIEVRYEEGKRSNRRGTHTDREIGTRTPIGEAPGVMPTFLMRHLLPVAVLVHKEDLEIDLPPIEELPAPIYPGQDPMDGDLLAEYRRLQGELLERIRADRFQPTRAGRLLGALVELPSYLDRATDDLEPFELRYPEELGGEWIATGDTFPAAWRTPKERWLLDELAGHLSRGEKVLVFLRHTGMPHLPGRLLRLIREVTPAVAWLDARKVPTGKREAWIDEHVLGRDVRVLLVNPVAVRTGLNNLVSFSAGLWYELDLSATTYRQANGRLHRIGQTRPVVVRIPYYARTAQATLFELIAKKVTASLQVDGLDLQAALEAAGASEEQTASLATAMSLGQAVYQALTRGL